jgi:hypothetical protein
VFVYAFIGIIPQQRDVPALVWTAAGGALLIAVMIATTRGPARPGGWSWQ